MSNGLKAEEKSPGNFVLIFCTFIRSSRCYMRWSGEYLLLSSSLPFGPFEICCSQNFPMKFHFTKSETKTFWVMLQNWSFYIVWFYSLITIFFMKAFGCKRCSNIATHYDFTSQKCLRAKDRCKRNSRLFFIKSTHLNGNVLFIPCIRFCYWKPDSSKHFVYANDNNDDNNRSFFSFKAEKSQFLSERFFHLKRHFGSSKTRKWMKTEALAKVKKNK